jgi:hypothetical protein
MQQTSAGISFPLPLALVFAWDIRRQKTGRSGHECRMAAALGSGSFRIYMT